MRIELPNRTSIILLLWATALINHRIEATESTPQAGIGVALKVEEGKVLVGSILPDSAAARSNSLKPNDRIMAVAEERGEPVDVSGFDMVKVVSQIRGQKGTIVRLTVVPVGKMESEARVISFTRGPVKTPFGGLGDGKPLLPGTVAPNFSFTQISDGKKYDLSHYQGRVVVLELWASWCKPCVEQIGKLETLEEDHPDWKGRVDVLAVSIDEKRDDAADCCKAHHWTKVPAVWSGPSTCDAYNIQGVPVTFVIDRNGKVVAVDSPLNVAEVIRQKHLLESDGK
jgi:thiol-disulfide isomerase/thioredoxin